MSSESFNVAPTEVLDAVDQFLDESHIVTHARTLGYGERFGDAGHSTRAKYYGQPGCLPDFYNGGQLHYENAATGEPGFLNLSFNETGFGPGQGVDFDLFAGMPEKDLVLARYVFEPDNTEDQQHRTISNQGRVAPGYYRYSQLRGSGRLSSEYYRDSRVYLGPHSRSTINIRPAMKLSMDPSAYDNFVTIPGSEWPSTKKVDIVTEPTTRIEDHKVEKEVRNFLGRKHTETVVERVEVPGPDRIVSSRKITGNYVTEVIRPLGTVATATDAKLPNKAAGHVSSLASLIRWSAGTNMYKFLSPTDNVYDLFFGYEEGHDVMVPVVMKCLASELNRRYNNGLVHNVGVPRIFDAQLYETFPPITVDLGR